MYVYVAKKKQRRKRLVLRTVYVRHIWPMKVEYSFLVSVEPVHQGLLMLSQQIHVLFGEIFVEPCYTVR